MSEDLYKILGLEKGAAEADIKRAYRKLAAKYHPDVNKNLGAEAKFKEIQNAYEILSDPHKKSQYDQFGSADPHAGFGGFNGYSAEDFDFAGGLGDIFETFFGGGGGTRKRGPAKGRNIETQVIISFEDSVRGVKKHLNLQTYAVCVTCNGRGMAEGSGYVECAKCRGAGQIFMRRQTPLGYVQTSTVCPDCRGEGRRPEKPCNVCGGSGRVVKDQQITIDIPPGIFDGGVLRVPGKGEAGERSEMSGDLLVHVQVTPSKKYVRRNDDIHSIIIIHVLQAVLGDEIDVDTVHGITKLRIPSGTQAEQMFRIKGKGMPHLGKVGFGDHLVKVKIDIPAKLSNKEKELYEEIVKESKLNVKSEKGIFGKIFE